MLENFEPKSIFRFFEELSAIPRGSGNEKSASDYLVDFAKKRNLSVHQDAALNVFIKKCGTGGLENAKPVILQGHMDMVCEKNEGTAHDFEKDPIKLTLNGDILKADGTTLGADNGVAVAYSLALLDSADIPHPPLEVLITTGEEIGLLGAGKVDGSLFKGRTLLNMDTSQEGSFTVSCAGGARADLRLKAEYSDLPPGFQFKHLSVRGLKGGHSGSDILKERGNSCRILGRILKTLGDSFEIRLADIKGGSKHNAIPREADAVIAFDGAKAREVEEEVRRIEQNIRREFFASDEGVHIFIEDCNCGLKKTFTPPLCKNIVRLLLLLPNGLQAMSAVFKGLPETSLNIGVIKSDENEIAVTASFRSSVVSRKQMITDQVSEVAAVTGANLEISGVYPAWEYNEKSELRTKAVKVYAEMFGKEPQIYGTHGGLECGILTEKIGGVDVISFGPNIYDLHTPDERMEVSSFKRMWEFLQKLLVELAK